MLKDCHPDARPPARQVRRDLRFLYTFIAILCISLFLLFSPQTVFAEQINNFSATYAIQSDGTVNVVETLQYDFGSLDRHGIYRTIPFITTNDEDKRFKIAFDDISIRDAEGNPYKFTRTTDGD